MKSKVSIVVPVYNCGDALDRTLECLTNQTLKETEIVCVNDGSTDNSLELLEHWKKRDGRIIIINQKNGGLSAARNAGIKNASSPYLMFCDADDLFDEKMCELMLRAIEDHNVDIAACGTDVKYEAHSEIADSDRNYYRIKFEGKCYINDDITARTDVSVCDKIFRADIIKKFNICFPKNLNNEDYYFYNAYMSVSRTIFFVNRKLYTYIRHDNSIMSDNFEGNSYSPDHLLVAQELFKFYKKNNFIGKHTDFFWGQFSESYWFSYEHSAKKYHKNIYHLAKKFILDNYSKYPASNLKVRRNIYIIMHNNLVHKIARYLKGILSRIYRKVNIAYKQQDYINSNIEKLEQNIYNLSDEIDKLERIYNGNKK